MMMDLDEFGTRFLQSQEGCRLQAYRDQKGVWTIGYGCTHGVTPDMTITQAQAESLFRTQVRPAVNAVNRFVHIALLQNEFNALVSLVYNIGEGNFRNSSVLRLLNQGDKRGAAKAFSLWSKIKNPETGELTWDPGLAARRQREANYFLTGKLA